MIGYIDSHAHIPICKESEDQIVQEAIENHFLHIMNVGYDPASSADSLKLAKKYSWIDAAFGIHPHYIGLHEGTLSVFLQNQLQNSEFKAVGEIGMDTVKSKTDLSLQRKCFSEQIAFALEHHYPIIVHNRDADQEVYDVIKQFSGIQGVMHCYSSDRKMAEKFLKLGFYLSFSGNITYKRSIELREVVKMVPKNKLLLETDCPYLTPIPYRGKVLNKPFFVMEVYKEAAFLRDVQIEELSKQIICNYRTLFHGGMYEC